MVGLLFSINYFQKIYEMAYVLYYYVKIEYNIIPMIVIIVVAY